MTDADERELDPKSLVGRLMEAGAKAPQVLGEAAVRSQAKSVAAYVGGLPRPRDADELDAVVDRVIRHYRTLARAEGAAAGITMTLAEVTTVVGSAGTLTLPAGAATLAGDLATLAWIQTRMVLVIAGLHGHDLEDHSTRNHELLTLMGVYGAGSAVAAADFSSKASQRVLRRLLMRYLRGDALKAVTAMFRMVGIKFARAGVLRALPMVNIPMNAAVNDVATRALGRKAHQLYRDLPSPESLQPGD